MSLTLTPPMPPLRTNALSSRVSPLTNVREGILDEFYALLCSTIDTPVSRHCANLYRQGLFKDLLDLRLDPASYDGADDFSRDYLVVSFLKKYPDFDLGINKEQAAFEKWLEAEESCSRVNYFMESWLEGGTPYPFRVGSLFEQARRKIAMILGDVNYDAVRTNCRFGPGVDLSTAGCSHSAYNKFATTGSITPWALPIVADLFSEDLREDLITNSTLVPGNKLSFVPKNAEILRSIGIESRWGIFLQLGVGGAIQKRLLKAGIDLKDQSSNQRAAQQAHCNGTCTIDLTDASNMQAKLLIAYLVDEEWCDLLFKLRSPSSSYKGKTYKLEKISSMGNGYTFPLETLVFYAFAHAAVTAVGADVSKIRVYGDDIIIPREAAPGLIEVLSYAGFSVNTKKTCLDGVFFESCGKDYWLGQNVRPFFQRKALRNVLDLMVLANQIVEYACQETDFADSRYKPLWDFVVECIPRRLRLYGSRGVSGVLHAPFDLCRPTRASDSKEYAGWEGWRFPAFVPVPITREGHSAEGHLFSKISFDVDMQQRYVVSKSYIWRKKKVYVNTYREFSWI